MTNSYEGITGFLYVYTYIVVIAMIAWTPFFVTDVFTLYWKTVVERRVNEWKGQLSAKRIEDMVGVFFKESRLAWNYGTLILKPTDDSAQKLRDSGLSDLVPGNSSMTAEQHEASSNVIPVQGWPTSRMWTMPN